MVEMLNERAVFWEHLYPDEVERNRVQGYIGVVSSLERVTKVVLVRFQGGDKLFLLFDDDWDGVLSKHENDTASDAYGNILFSSDLKIQALFFRTESGFEDFIKSGSGELKDTQQITLWKRPEILNAAA